MTASDDATDEHAGRSRTLAAAVGPPLRRALPAFLPTRRWFAGKARTIAAATLEDLVIPSSAGLISEGMCADAGRDTGTAPADVALALVRVDYTCGEAERYALLLAITDEPGTLPRIAADDEGRRVIVEASGAAFAVRALAAGFLESTHSITTASGARLRYRDVPAGGVAADDLAIDAIRPLAAEQSNSSVRLGDRLLLKLFRVVADGENPEVEVGRFLTAAGFPATAALRGSIAYLRRVGEGRTFAVLQEWRANDGDGWSWVVARLRRLAAGGVETTSDGAGEAAPAFASGAEVTARLERAMRELGRTTAELHATLAAASAEPAFVPEPVTATDVGEWTSAVRARAARLWPRLAERAPSLDAAARALVATITDARVRIDVLASPPRVDGAGAFRKIRIHGDYHLGQTLRVSDGFLVIDFEGEPARPLAERRAKQCALKDVAGMLRSFAYAADVAAAADAEPLLREAFLAAYEERAGSATFLPADARARRAWLDFFELEKALYEVEYELDHRPAWTHIPLRAVAAILGGRS